MSVSVRRLGLVVSQVVTMGLFLSLAHSARAAEWSLVVSPQDTDPGPTPIVVPVDRSLPSGPYTATPLDGGSPFAVLVYDEGQAHRLAAVLPKVDAKQAQVYRLNSGSPSNAPTVGLKADDKTSNTTVLLDGKPFVTLVLNDATKPYLYPVIGPTGQPFTRAYPMESVEGEDRDHPHQRSFWFTHGNVNGHDFWGSDPLNKNIPRARIIPRDVSVRTATPGSGLVEIHQNDDWVGPDGKKVCEDERILRFYANNSPRFIDVDVTIKATNGPVTFGDTKEGMFGLRIASSLDVKRKQGGKITNAEGVTDNAAWGKASPWVDYTGPLDGKIVGIAILNHPDSFRFPTTWHVRDYGLFAANPFGYHDFGMKEKGEYTVPAGESIRFRYRVILHEGDTNAAHIPAAFATYARPPKVEVKPE